MGTVTPFLSNTFLLIFVYFLSQPLIAQQENPSQTVRGQVIDNQTHTAIPGATVLIADTSKIFGVPTDAEGYFRLNAVPVGRHKLKISSVGYKPAILQILVTSGKEVVLTIALEEVIVQADEVIVTAKSDKTKANNEMTTVSARSFSIEESQRYAGSRNDPARMASNYAGVSGANDARNDIIIRGNSPQGLLWRLNGIDIPNPNHFGSLGTTGGPVSILNNNTLSNSDFMTGAFPAEYGNALAGVFDLKMRTGNNEKHEFMGQIGFNGFELGVEGPISKKSKAAYLVNYRYSTLSVFHALNIDLGTGSAIPQYQDITFNVDVPTAKAGKFNLFGMGGVSYVEMYDSKNDASKKNFYGYQNQDIYFGSNTGAIGLSHSYLFNEKTIGKLIVAMSGYENIIRSDLLDKTDKTIKTLQYGNLAKYAKMSMAYSVLRKINPQHTVKTGIFVDNLLFNLKDSVLQNNGTYLRLRNSEGNTYLIRAYCQWRYKLNANVTLNTGLQYQHLTLNSSYAIEPRVGLRWSLAEQHALSAAVGMHSQMQNISTYFDETQLNDGTYIQTNKNLRFSKSNHFIVGYDYNIAANMRLKVETYYQYNYNVPVMIRPNHYSMTNAGADFENPSIDSLVNNGSGYNYGVELTLERFYHKGYYFLFTSSFFESKYKGSDGIIRNTAFNGNFVCNALAGKEFNLNKKNILVIDWKLTWAGGKRFVPVDLAKSNIAGKAVYNVSEAYTHRYKDYFRTDVKIGFKRNGKRVTQEWSVDTQNILNTQNIFQQTYDSKNQNLRTEYQMGLFIVPQYRITF